MNSEELVFCISIPISLYTILIYKNTNLWDTCLFSMVKQFLQQNVNRVNSSLRGQSKMVQKSVVNSCTSTTKKVAVVDAHKEHVVNSNKFTVAPSYLRPRLQTSGLSYLLAQCPCLATAQTLLVMNQTRMQLNESNRWYVYDQRGKFLLGLNL